MKRTTALFTISSLLVSCGSDPAHVATSTGKPFASRIEGKAGLPNLALMAPGIYRGGQPSAEGFRTLKEMGVRTVIGFRSNTSTKDEVEAAGLASVELPIQASVFGSEPPTDEQIELFFRTALDPARRPVFFHCKHGKDRTGTMAALYRIEVDGWTNDEAIEEMQSFGYHDIYKDLIEFVRTYRPRGYAAGK
jgi:tyrosine-protein phosphatase SIW14